mgnify:FL=1
MLRFVRGRHTGISSATARNSRRHRLATRAVFAQRTPQRHAHRRAPLVLSRTRTHLPDPHEKTPSFLSFPPMILGAHPVSRFQHRLSRMHAYARASRAPQSVSEKNLHLFTHLTYFTNAQRIKGEDFIIFSFTSLVPWLHPESEEFSSRIFAENRHQSRRNRGSKTVKAKVKEKSKNLHP